MPTIISGDGTITGLTTTGISAVQQLPAGSVLQVVQSSYDTNTANATSTYIDTGLAASITPKFSTSKILVIVNQQGCGKVVSNTGVNLRLLRNSTTINQIASGFALNGQTGTTNRFLTIAGTYLDSPATTSSIQYKTQFASSAGNSQVNVQDFGGSDLVVSTITLLEIAA